jgi:hypothetical protein
MAEAQIVTLRADIDQLESDKQAIKNQSDALRASAAEELQHLADTAAQSEKDAASLRAQLASHEHALKAEVSRVQQHAVDLQSELTIANDTISRLSADRQELTDSLADERARAHALELTLQATRAELAVCKEERTNLATELIETRKHATQAIEMAAGQVLSALTSAEREKEARDALAGTQSRIEALLGEVECIDAAHHKSASVGSGFEAGQDRAFASMRHARAAHVPGPQLDVAHLHARPDSQPGPKFPSMLLPDPVPGRSSVKSGAAGSEGNGAGMLETDHAVFCAGVQARSMIGAPILSISGRFIPNMQSLYASEV